MKGRDLTRLHTALVNKDAHTLQEELTDILYETISSFDENENYYHGLVAGLLFGMKGYRTKSSRETGKGRCDLFVKPISRRKEAFILKFKTTKKIKQLEKRRRKHCSRSMIKNTLWNLKTTAMPLQAATRFHFAERTAVLCFGKRDKQ